MKFYRRHKHELEHKEGDDPLPPPPTKKMRYTKADDVLLAKFFANRPEGTTDKVFPEFGRIVRLSLNRAWLRADRLVAPSSSLERLARAPSDS